MTDATAACVAGKAMAPEAASMNMVVVHYSTRIDVATVTMVARTWFGAREQKVKQQRRENLTAAYDKWVDMVGESGLQPSYRTYLY